MFAGTDGSLIHDHVLDGQGCTGGDAFGKQDFIHL